MIDKNSDNLPSKQIARPTSQLDIDCSRILRRHWPILLICVLVGWGAAATYYLVIPPTYESQADLLLMPKDPNLAARGLESNRDVNSTLSDDLLATHMMLVQSTSIVKDALKNSKLDKLPSLLEAMSDDDRSTTEYVIRKLYVSRGGVGKAKNAQVLKVSMRHNNAEDTHKVVSAIVNEFRTFIDKKYTDVNQSAALLIEKAQGQLKLELEVAESDFRGFRENAPLLWNGDKSTNIYRTEYEQIESSLTDLRMQRTELDSRLKMVESQLKSIASNGGGDIQKLALVDEKSAERIKIFLEIYAGKAESQLFQSQQPERLEAARGEYEGLLRLKSRLQSLIADFGEEQTEVRALRSEIKTIEDFIKQRTPRLQISSNEEVLTAGGLVNAYVSLLHHDLEVLQDRERLLVESSHKAESEAKALVRYELEGEMLRLSVDRQKVLFDATVDRLREINLAKDYGGFVNELIKEPEIGEEVWPKGSICGLIGTLGGLLLGCLSVCVLELRNRSLRTVEDIEEVSKVSNVSLVPMLTIHKESKSRREIAASGSQISPVVVTQHFVQSREAEVFRGLRTALMFKIGLDDMRVIAVTSPTSGDGKSTVLSNLAVSLAQAGRRVLLIDADMRRPTIAKIFGVTNNIGLADLLTGKDTLFNSVSPSECGNLDLLVAGTLPSNPSELLASAAFVKMIDLARTEYDLVLVDSPPVLAVADPCVIAPIVDAMLVVLRLNANSRTELQRTIHLLTEVKANVVGTVVNASKLESADTGKIDQYGYGYGTYGTKSDPYTLPRSTTVRKPIVVQREPKVPENKVRYK